MSLDSTNTDTIPGYMDLTLDLNRINFGLADNDDDHRPDDNGILDYDKMRLDHAVFGDTMRSIVKGEVIMDQDDHSFSKLIVRMKIGISKFFDLSTPNEFAMFLVINPIS